MTKQQNPEVAGFGDRLARMRKAAGFTQEELARRIGVSRRVIAYYEGETEHPPTQILPRLAQALNVGVEMLLQGNKEEALAQVRSSANASRKTVYPIASGSGSARVREVFNEDDIKVMQGDSRRALQGVPDEVFQCCITSPPYWGLRDYGIKGQIGAENNPDAYIGDLVGIFREVRRTLREDGTLWLNIGDSYTSGDRRWRAPDKKNAGRAMSYRPPTPEGLKPKDLIGVPWRLALALQADGWFLRSDIIWNKPNCQPESVKDRPTRAHEYIFLMSKAESYFYDFEPSASRPRTVRIQRTDERSGTSTRTVFTARISPCSRRSWFACACWPDRRRVLRYWTHSSGLGPSVWCAVNTVASAWGSN